MTALHAKLMDGRVSKLQIKSALICCRGVIQKLRGQDEGVGGQRNPIIVHVQGEKYPHRGCTFSRVRHIILDFKAQYKE